MSGTGWIGKAWIAMAAAATLSGCAAAEPSCTQPDEAPRLVAELYLGLGLPGGGDVSEAAWQRFLAEIVTPRFPDGLTVVDADGQWRASAGGDIGRENSKLLIIVAAPGTASEVKLDQIADAYKTRFHQQSVLLVESRRCAAFR